MDFLLADTLGIQMDLIALRPETEPFTIHFYQHSGKFFGSNERIGNQDQDIAINQFNHFFDAARQKNSDLVLTPEYSCPWAIICEMINNEQLWPAAGKLWVLGCESISIAELTGFHQHCDKPNVFLHHEVANPENNKVYYDPLLYLFRGRHENQDKLIVLVQFKTKHMGTRVTAMERDHLIEGRLIYILRNQGESNRFITIVCSEAMIFANELTRAGAGTIGWNDFPYFIYHPQANPDPTHDVFVSFRKFVLLAERKEILSLNWSNKSMLGAKKFIKNGTTRSGIYTQSNEIDLREPRFKDNHGNGLYYHSFGNTNHAYFFNNNMDIFHVSLPSVRIIAAAGPIRLRDGPRVLEVENYDIDTARFSKITAGVPDAHLHYLGEVHCGCDFLLNATGCILEKERLVCLSCGMVNVGELLVNIPSIPTFEMKQDTELNRRMTVIDDSRPEAVQRNSGYVSSINVLIQDIIPKKNEVIYPESIRDLRTQDITIGFSNRSAAESYRFNVISINGESKMATMVYVGGISEKAAGKIFDAVQSLFNTENRYKRRVLVYYRGAAGYVPISDDKAGDITHTDQEDGPIITNTQK